MVVSADQAPVTAAPATLLDNAAVTVALPGITVTDGDAVAYHETTTVVLSDASGLLAAVAATGATVAGECAAVLTLSGSLAAVDAELATLTYTGASANAPVSDGIDVATNDGRGGANDHKIAVTVDQPPVTTVPGPLKVASGVAVALSGLSVADSDPTAGTATFTSTFYDTSGGVLFATPTAGGTVTGAGTKILALSGSLAQLNAELATVSYKGTLVGHATSATDTITVVTSDGHGESDKHTIGVTITPTGSAAGADTSSLAALFAQYMAAGFESDARRPGLGEMTYIPPAAHHLDLAAHH